jgi:predicted ATPase/DNA-binding winged helix-turn-helix (wHTH) protein
MASEAETSTAHVLAFGPFRLLPVQRMLQEGDKPIVLGSRALDILFALVERSGELVGKDELMARVWPNTVVEEATLRVHVAALRKVLGGSQCGVRYVENVTGRGYRFVAPVTRLDEDRPASETRVVATPRRHNLPAPLSRMIGRSEVVNAVAARLLQRRIVTIIGPGGIGKTTVALAAADNLSASYPHGACFVDLASIMDPRLVPSTLASALGLEVLSHDPIPALLAFLGDKRLLIVLDNCEHVVAAAAALAEKVLIGAPGVHILATSREALRSEGEWVHRLSPLAMPPPSTTLTAVEAAAFPAIQLFVERAMASLDSFAFDDANLSIVVDVCRRLDGIPLAIELAAARIDPFGLRGLAAQLEDCLRLLTKGRRTALPRHQTLRATLDWSYRLLSEAEQIIFRRIAVFPGRFDLESASAVAAGGDISAADLFDGITNLAAKSLITTDLMGEQVLFRLLNTTRAYALEMLQSCNESAMTSRRHAEHCCTVYEAVQSRSDIAAAADWLTTNGGKIDDVRAALGWSFSPDGDTAIGVRLTIASASVWFRLGVVDEYRQRMEQALEAIEADPTSSTVLEMRLNAILGSALMQTKGPGSATIAAFNKAFEVADRLGDTGSRWRALLGLGTAHVAAGEYRSAVDFAERARLDAMELDEDAAIMSERLLAITYHFAGDQASARRRAEHVLSRPVRVVSSLINDVYHLDHRVAARATLCRILWIQGHPDQAIRAAQDGVADGESADHVLSLCYALFGACTVVLWAGDVVSASRLVAMLLEHSTRHSLPYWHFWGRCFDTVLELRQGDAAKGLANRRELQRDPLFSSLHLDTLATLSEDLVGAEAITRAEAGRAGWCSAEILRVQGLIVLNSGAADAGVVAEALFRRSLDTARREGMLAWELRTATTLARLWRDHGRIPDAYDLLASIHGRFTEGFGTADLVKAKTLLAELVA